MAVFKSNQKGCGAEKWGNWTQDDADLWRRRVHQRHWDAIKLPTILESCPNNSVPPSATEGNDWCYAALAILESHKMEILKGADESWELGLLLGDWEPGGPEGTEPHSPPLLVSSAAFHAFCSTGNWSVFLYLHYKIDFVKSPFFNDKSCWKVPCSELCCALLYCVFSVCLLSLTSWPLG